MNYRKQLLSILEASGWSQERLAQKLKVSFPTLNSWINERSVPRHKAIGSIHDLFLDIVGVDSVDSGVLEQEKSSAMGLRLSAKELLDNKRAMDSLTLYLTYHTNTIEGSTMTLSDVEEVIFEHKVLTNRTATEQAEARNHQAALYWLVEQLIERGDSLKVNEELILGIHLRLMNGIVGDAGRYRTHAVRIMGTHVTLANYMKVPELVNQLAIDIVDSSDDIIASLASTHARFERIHPFSDGNGRAGRLIMLMQALQSGMVPPLIVKERKHAYYKYLELAQTKETYGQLEQFIAQSMQFTKGLLDGDASVIGSI